MESYDVEVGIRGNMFPVKPVREICGHDIKRYRIHGEKAILFVKSSDQTKMEHGEIFAIGTFGSTGRGYYRDGVSSLAFTLLLSQPTVLAYSPWIR